MLKFWIRKYFFLAFSSLCTFLIFSFFMSHIFFGDRSLWKIFELNKDIFIAEIDLLRDDKIDSDIISEISQEMLGLIQPDQIVIKILK